MLGKLTIAAAALLMLMGRIAIVHAQTSSQNLGNAAGGEGAQYGPLGAAEPGAGGTGRTPSPGMSGNAGASSPNARPDGDRLPANPAQLNRANPGAGTPSVPAQEDWRTQAGPQRAQPDAAASGALLHGQRPNRLSPDMPPPNRPLND
jgi:hypothetical protein